MLTWIENLFKTNKIAFWALIIILAPILIMIVFKNVMMGYLATKINKTTQDAQKKDQTLTTAVTNLTAQAAQDQQAADALAKEAQNDTVDADWNVKK